MVARRLAILPAQNNSAPSLANAETVPISTTNLNRQCLGSVAQQVPAAVGAGQNGLTRSGRHSNSTLSF